MKETLMQVLTDTRVAGNELWRIGLFFGMLLVAMGAARMVAQFMNSAAARIEPAGRLVSAATLRAGAGAASLIGFAVGLKLGLAFLILPDMLIGPAATATAVVITLSITHLAFRLVDAVGTWLAAATEKTKSRMDDMLAPLVRKSLRITIVVLAILQIATLISDKPLPSLIAGLGVGGLAIALAAQETVKNFFGSMVILGDKPFELGDRVLVDGHDGPVESVGFRSTRIRTLDGHVVTIPNGELANKTIQNIGRRPYIRRVANIAITYDTPPEKVKLALDIIRKLLENHEGMRPELPPRVYFDSFNDSSLNLLAIYWYHPPEYWSYLAFSERFNLSLLQRFNDEGIEFAFPTQTIHLADERGDPP